jgi:hypothetical protein
VQSSFDELPGSFTGSVFIDGNAIPYAKIQEEGGTTRAHDIFPVNASVLAFMAPAKMGFSGGPKQNGMVFAKAVHHPGSRIPEHPYARLALYRERPIFANGVRAIVEEAIAT